MSDGDLPPEIAALFGKRHTYTKDPAWRLPAPSEVLTGDHEELPHLLSLKESLNKVKNLLSDQKLDDWHRHTSFTNVAGRVVPEVRRRANAELCTQAWCKFQEIVCGFPLIPAGALWQGELNSVHLCEAPGAFVASLNHYVRTRALRCDWTWVANTLNPYHEANDGVVMIADDRLIANTLPWWYFGPDNTGDIMTPEYLAGLRRFLGGVSAVHLVTADGSFDCQGNPGEQEALVYPLHYCEVVTCLSVLSPGGSFVLKMFTLLQHSSLNLLYLLNCVFGEVHVAKPATSKAGNSEVYVVCLGYLGVPPGLLDKMAARLAGEEIGGRSLFPRESLPASFVEAHSRCCALFHRHQTETILENLRLFSAMGEGERARLEGLREAAVLHYLQAFRVRHLPRSQWLVRKPRVGCSLNARWLGTRNRRADTYNQRKEAEALTWDEKVARGFFGPWLEDHVRGDGGLLEGCPSDLRYEDWFSLWGRRLARIQSSSFCDGELLNAFNETLGRCGGGEAGCPARCPSCAVPAMDGLVAELLGRVDVGGHVMVVGAPRLFEALSLRHAAAALVESPPSPASVLHDGDPAYQRRLADSVLLALRKLPGGGALALPLQSCLTRFTAGVVYVLYRCFQVIGFSCPTSDLAPGSRAVLLCWGYHPLPSPALQHLQELLADQAPGEGEPHQILEFVPMEELLTGPFLEFLWDLNSAVIRHCLHLIGRREHERVARKADQSQAPVPANE
ncbi:cap-specific mRNA (nucleoside-2'-O-)-methyltransferase 2 [Mantella aurantiaca]